MKKRDIFKYAFLIGAGYTAGTIVTRVVASVLQKTHDKVKEDLGIELNDETPDEMKDWSDEDKYCGRQMCYMHQAAKKRAEEEASDKQDVDSDDDFPYENNDDWMQDIEDN